MQRQVVGRPTCDCIEALTSSDGREEKGGSAEVIRWFSKNRDGGDDVGGERAMISVAIASDPAKKELIPQTMRPQ
jgi:hypothetical protein